MRCPMLSELPLPSSVKTGWPWDVESKQLPPAMPDGSPWPKISIITPSYNQGQYLEETLRSVLLQGYPNLEFIVMDGGSTDASVDIIKKYQPWLSYWASEHDNGQTHAINKGLDFATGEIVAYLNSDDLYLPGALHEVASCFHGYQGDIVVGKRKPHSRAKLFLIRPVWWKNVALKPYSSLYLFSKAVEGHIPQECVFWNFVRYRDLRLDESFHFSMDQWLYIHIFSGARAVYTTQEIGYFRLHPDSKSSTSRSICKENMERLRLQYSSLAESISHSTVRRLWSLYRWESFKAFFLSPFMKMRFSYIHPDFLT